MRTDPKAEDQKEKPKEKPKQKAKTKPNLKAKVCIVKSYTNRKKIEEDLEDKTKKKEKKESTVLADSEIAGIVRQHLSDEDVIARFMDYVENRKAMGKRYAMRTQRAVTLNLNVIQNKPKAEALEILNKAILRNWTGLFEDKQNESAQTPQSKCSSEERRAWTS